MNMKMKMENRGKHEKLEMMAKQYLRVCRDSSVKSYQNMKMLSHYILLYA